MADVEPILTVCLEPYLYFVNGPRGHFVAMAILIPVIGGALR